MGQATTCRANTLPDELRESVRRNATSVRMATANGPTTAQDVVDVDIPGLDARARVLLLQGCPPVLSLGRLVEEHRCRFEWNEEGATLVDHLGTRHECIVKNYVPFLNAPDYAFPAPPEGEDDDLLGDIQPEIHHELNEDKPGMVHDLTHLRKREDCEACRCKIKATPGRRKNPALRERPAGWGHTLLADHLSASDLKCEKQDFKLCLVCLCAGTSYGDVIPVKSKRLTTTIMALREFYGEDQFYFMYSGNASELKAACSQQAHAPPLKYSEPSQKQQHRGTFFPAHSRGHQMPLVPKRTPAALLDSSGQSVLLRPERDPASSPQGYPLGSQKRSRVRRQAHAVRM